MSRYSFTWTETLSPEAPAHGPTCYTRAQVHQACAPHEAGTEPTRGAGFHKYLVRYLAGLLNRQRQRAIEKKGVYYYYQR